MTTTYTPLLKRELDAYATTKARHALAITLADLHHNKPAFLTKAAREFRWDAEYECILRQHEALREAAKHFPRQHRRCLVCRELCADGDTWFCRPHWDADLHRGDYPAW